MITLTQSENGRSIVVSNGTLIQIELTATPPQRAGNLTSQDVSVVDFVSGSTSPATTIQQIFRAVGTGQTNLTGVFDGCPSSAPACIPQPVGFHITVQ